MDVMKQTFRFRVALLVFFLASNLMFSQEKTISGVVTDEENMPLPGANVLVKGTTFGTQTDFDGSFTIEAAQGQTLVFSYLGLKTQERTISSTNIINVQMEEDAEALQEVVVTALGIKKEKQALGYAVSEVNSEEIEQQSQGDIARILTGKASGVQINQQSGLSGSGTNIVIRGLNSFSTSNQALFIVDGVPFSGDTNSQGRQGDRNDFVNGNNGSSRFLDLDPNTIESVNVLKGLAAATLYGSQGKNGVILITTKGGATGSKKPKNEISLTSSMFFNEIASLPDYQNSYGGGFDQAFGWFFSNWGPRFNKEGVDGWGNDPAFDANGTLPHPYSTAQAATGVPQAFPEFQGVRYQWKPYNSVKKFFRTGTVVNTSLNARGSSEDGKISYNLNYGHLKDEGFTPGNSVARNNLSIGGSAELTNRFTVSGTLNYSRTDFKSPPVALSQGNGATGTGSSAFGDLWFTPRNVDIQSLPYENPVTGSSVYYRQTNDIQNPLWTLANSGSRQLTNRTFGNASIGYELNDNLSFTYRVGLDIYNEYNVNYQNKGGVNSNSGDARLLSGIFETWNNVNTIWDHNLVLTGDFPLSDKIGFSFNLGATSRREDYNRNGVSSDGQQVFNVLKHFNFLNNEEIEFTSLRNLVGVYGELNFDYDRYLYITLSGRNDWASNFDKANRSLFYPSASLSFIPTQLFEGIRSEKGLNYLKIRAGYGTSAGFNTLNPYPIASTLILVTNDTQDSSGRNVVTNTSGPTLGNPNLKPETLSEIELGIESAFFMNRVTLDLSIYNRITKDLIVNRPLDPITGFTNTDTNVGQIDGKGIELDLGVFWVKSQNDGFSWNSNLNFTANKTKVTDLGLDTERVVYSGFGNLGNAAIPGEPLGVFYGSRVARDPATGAYLVDANGNYLQDQQDGIIGDPNPDWIGNLSNSISYKNFTLGFQLNYVQGGDVYSSTIATLLGRGLIPETTNRRETFVLKGLGPNGQPNNVQINNSDFYFTNVLFGPSELQVFDATTIRLQECSLAYSLPTKFLDRTPFGSLSFTVSGYNLWYEAINTPKGANFDPNTSGTGVGNGVGFDFLNGPSSRRYGLSIKATF